MTGITFWLSLLAEALQAAGRRGAASDVLDEAFAVAEGSGERWWIADLHRRRGELDLSPGRAGPIVEDRLRMAIETAAAAGAASLELRAWTSLARNAAQTKTRREARDRLSSLYAALDEVAETRDGRAAREVLAGRAR